MFFSPFPRRFSSKFLMSSDLKSGLLKSDAKEARLSDSVGSSLTANKQKKDSFKKGRPATQAKIKIQHLVPVSKMALLLPQHEGLLQ